MSTRTSDILAMASGLLLLAGCQTAPSGPDAANSAAPVSPIEAVKRWVSGESDERPRIYCAVGKDAALAQNCRIEIVEDAIGRMLIISQSDGGFRRLRIGANDALSVADGAGEPKLTRSGEITGILFENERYAVPMSALRPAAKP